ncbi:hypothetical protein [Oerskovia enterophila]|uniref:VWA domain-containing protein n=1 Tax=Oerskovia enterophila TaxID=43678 RepID=A0ABX2Y9I5_9CELL|nr:hypothetical protein [Oerskovia enterophila]OCI30570.1 hypothetical protein OERS_27330 [Oerskovia enterophila]
MTGTPTPGPTAAGGSASLAPVPGAGRRHAPSRTRLRDRWLAAWPEALAAWGTQTRLHAPVLHHGDDRPQDVGSFAWFSTVDVEVHIDLDDIAERGLEDHAVAVLAHEIGHHLLSPGDLTTSARILSRVRDGLVDLDPLAGAMANLWSDLLVNDRLQRRAGLDMAAIFAALGAGRAPLAQMVMRTDEILWGLPRGTLTHPDHPVPEREASLCARLVRAYANDPVGGAGGFAALIRPLLVAPPSDEPGAAPGGSADGAGPAADGGSGAALSGGQHGILCSQSEPAGAVPAGLATDPTPGRPVLHPAVDPRVTGATPSGPDEERPLPVAASDTTGAADALGQAISPAHYDAVLRLLGLTTSSAQSAARWYREHAMRFLVPFPVRTDSPVDEELLGGHEQWDLGEDLADVDWAATVLRSPVIVPGVTTVRRVHEQQDGHDPAPRPYDLDLYLDSSGSMPDPKQRLAPIALAGAVLALSALRAGARVQATTWSGPGQIAGTDGFTRDADAILAAIVAHFGGGTSFPVPLLERTHLGDPVTGAPPVRTRPAHVSVISDDGISSMFLDHLGGWPLDPSAPRAAPDDTLAARAVRAAGGGGSLVLQGSDELARRVAGWAPGYRTFAVSSTEDLVRFSRDFSRTLWTTKGADRAR